MCVCVCVCVCVVISYDTRDFFVARGWKKLININKIRVKNSTSTFVIVLVVCFLEGYLRVITATRKSSVCVWIRCFILFCNSENAIQDLMIILILINQISSVMFEYLIEQTFHILVDAHIDIQPHNEHDGLSFPPISSSFSIFLSEFLVLILFTFSSV